jgi:acetylornithine deacetylase/succinyl-diaminopimelate desuccinylase-like protein
VALLSALSGRDLDGDPERLTVALDEIRSASPRVAAFLIEPMLRITMVPTQARASEKENVIPSHAELLVDCRVPPGLDEDDARRRAEELLGSPNGAAATPYELEFVEHAAGNRSPARSPLIEMIEAWLSRADPGATLVPSVMAGFSDSNWFRRAFGSALVYGFCPQRELSLVEATPLVHNADERAAVADIELAARFYRDIVRAALG